MWGFLLFAAVWLICHPYQGIAGDAILYTVQALRHLHPERYATDVFFLGVSQDDYTLFSPLYASLIDLLGLGKAALTLAFFGALLWCYGAWRFAKQWPDTWSRSLFLFFLAVMPVTFGGYGILSAAEPFPAPRVWANALTLLACALWLEKKPYLAGLSWLAAMLLHPLMALAGLAFVLFQAFRFKRDWLYAVLGGVALTLLLAVLQAPLFGRLFQMMGPEWFDLVYQRTSLFMFPSRWRFADYGAMAFHMTVLAWAAWSGRRERLGRVFAAAGLVGLSGWLLALIGGDWLHSVLILQVQPWRLLWLSYVVGWGAAAYLAVRHWNASRPLVLALALAWLSHEEGGVALLWLALLIWHWRENLRPFHMWLVEGALLLGLAAELYSAWSEFMLSLQALDGPDDKVVWDRLYYGFRLSLPPRGEPMGMLLLAPVAVWLWQKSRALALGLFLPLGLLLLSDWDSHLDAGKLLRPETYAIQQEGFWGSSPFNRLVPLDAEIYWPEGLEMTWVGMGRSSYYSLHQSAGLVFSEVQAKEIYRRYLAMKPLGGRDQFFKLLTLEDRLKLMGSAVPLGTLDGLKQACHAEPMLDYVVLANHYPAWAKASWYAPFLPGGAHLYSCDSFRIHTTG